MPRGRPRIPDIRISIASAAADREANAVATSSAADIAPRTVANGEAGAADVCKCIAGSMGRRVTAQVRAAQSQLDQNAMADLKLAA